MSCQDRISATTALQYDLAGNMTFNRSDEAFRPRFSQRAPRRVNCAVEMAERTQLTHRISSHTVGNSAAMEKAKSFLSLQYVFT